MYFPSFPEAPTMQTVLMCAKPAGTLTGLRFGQLGEPLSLLVQRHPTICMRDKPPRLTRNDLLGCPRSGKTDDGIFRWHFQPTFIYRRTGLRLPAPLCQQPFRRQDALHVKRLDDTWHTFRPER